jgi:DNA-directed RNA polymerase subunit M/transcription elongation factor TFIIS
VVWASRRAATILNRDGLYGDNGMHSASSYKERSNIAAHVAVPTCAKCGATKFTHQDQEFGGEMTRIIFCTSCGAVIGVVIAI